jgi:hypothetical protein
VIIVLVFQRRNRTKIFSNKIIKTKVRQAPRAVSLNKISFPQSDYTARVEAGRVDISGSVRVLALCESEREVDLETAGSWIPTAQSLVRSKLFK